MQWSNCCSRSSTICKTACKAYHAIKFGGDIITYKDINKEIIKVIYQNITNYINITKEIINLIDQYNIINQTNIINITKTLTKIIWKEKFNVSNLENITRINFLNKTRWIK